MRPKHAEYATNSNLVNKIQQIGNSRCFAKHICTTNDQKLLGQTRQLRLQDGHERFEFHRQTQASQTQASSRLRASGSSQDRRLQTQDSNACMGTQ
jgi:hypothetical protein